MVLPKHGLVSSMRGEAWMKQFPTVHRSLLLQCPEKFQNICSKWKLPPAVLNCAKAQALRFHYMQKAFRPGLHPGDGRGCSDAAALLLKGRSMGEKEAEMAGSVVICAEGMAFSLSAASQPLLSWKVHLPGNHFQPPGFPGCFPGFHCLLCPAFTTLCNEHTFLLLDHWIL